MMTPEQMAALNARAFAGQGRAWTADEFAELLVNDHVFAVGDARAFALGRVVADESELLSIATDPDLRRQGLARACLGAYEAEAARRGAGRCFLEVAGDNAPALALYLAYGFRQVARRKGYYQLSGGQRQDALILQKTVSGPRPP